MTQIALPYPISREWSPKTAQAIEDNFRRIFGSSGRLGAPAGASLTNGLDLLDPAIGDLIACMTAAGLFELVPIVSTDQRVLVNTGGKPTWGLVNLTTAKGVTGLLPIANLALDGNVAHLLHGDGTQAAVNLASQVTGLLPLANLVSFTATQRLWARNSAGSGVAEEVTLSQVLDWLSATQGALPYRGSAAWAALAPGATPGMLLQTGGSGADPSWVTPGGGVSNNLINQAYYEVWGRPSSFPFNGIQGVPTNIGTAPTIVNRSQGSFVQHIQTGTTAGLRAGFISARNDYCEADADPTFEIVVRTGATMTNIRFWIGICDADLATNGDDQGGTTKYAAFRYSTVVPDGGWVGVCRDGTTQSAATGTVAAIAASTLYKLKIRKSGSTVFFSVNGGAELSIASNLPAAATALGFAAMCYNSVNSATHAWEFSRLRCYYGS